MSNCCLVRTVWEYGNRQLTGNSQNYPKDEFMYVLEGSPTIVDEDGCGETFVSSLCLAALPD